VIVSLLGPGFVVKYCVEDWMVLLVVVDMSRRHPDVTRKGVHEADFDFERHVLHW
jgi:hypothetical protein